MGIDDEPNASKISTYNNKNMYNNPVYVRLNMCRVHTFES